MTDSIACPTCGARATGKFCSSCGTSLGPRACPACGTSAAADARFCRGCGAAMPATHSAAEPRTPWIIAAILSVAAVAAIVHSAGRRSDAEGPAMANAGNAGATATTSTPLGPAPDISNLTPREQFARLNDRVMAAAEAGDSTTVITFWPMAAGAYDNLLPGDRDVDARYHMATLHLLVGRFPAALALADTIEAESPGNLLGWYVRGIVAEYQNDAAALATARREFTRRFDAEMAKDLEEYRHHGDQLRAYRTAPIGGN